jgi:type I site-specific restriction endonuclease
MLRHRQRLHARDRTAAIKSRILFEQLLGRGTRKGENITDKSHFTVFDCFDGTLLEYFRKATAITARLSPLPEVFLVTGS